MSERIPKIQITGPGGGAETELDRVLAATSPGRLRRSLYSYSPDQLSASDDDQPTPILTNEDVLLQPDLGFITDSSSPSDDDDDDIFMKQRKSSLQMDKGQRDLFRISRKRSEPSLSELMSSDHFGFRSPSPQSLRRRKKDPSYFTPEKKNHTKNTFAKKNLFLPLEEIEGHTDVEDLEYDDMDDFENRAVSFLPESKREIVIANQNMKGDVALILPINKPSNMKATIKMEAYDCGFSDVEDLPDYSVEDELKPQIPTPEPPLTEASYIKSSDIVKELNKLHVMRERPEPLTDTEEIDVKREVKQKRGKLRDSLHVATAPEDPLTDTEEILIRGSPRHGSYPHTDNEELVFGDEDEGAIGGLRDETDLEDFSDEFSMDEEPPRSPMIISSRNITTEREGRRDTKLKEPAGKKGYRRRSSSGSDVPRYSEVEDLSGVESEGCGTPRYKPPPTPEPVSSTVHIQSRRCFHPSTDELKFPSPPDPLTDIEDLPRD